MAIQLTVESLSPISHNQIPVITTELLAQLYGTEPVRIRQGHTRNKDRFIEGKHYFIVKGEDLENLKVSLRYFQNVAPNVRKLILWTERGAARHAKMLETDQAWDVFEKLEDSYFKTAPTSPTQIPHPHKQRFVIYMENGLVTCQRPVLDSEYICTIEAFLEIARKANYLVIHRDDLTRHTSF